MTDGNLLQTVAASLKALRATWGPFYVNDGRPTILEQLAARGRPATTTGTLGPSTVPQFLATTGFPQAALAQAPQPQRTTGFSLLGYNR